MNKPKFFIFFILLLPLLNVQAELRNFETARLKGTAGTGVGSLLLNEAAILNPASLSFYNITSISINYQTLNYNGVSQGADDWSRKKQFKHKSESLIVADTKNSFKGAATIIRSQVGYDSSEVMSAAVGTPLGKATSMGVLFKYSKENIQSQSSPEKKKYFQTHFGFTRVINENISLGAVLADPFKSKKEDQFAILGLQYATNNILTFMADVGSNYDTTNFTKNIMYRGAIQLSLLYDLYLRSGYFVNKKLGETGFGLGASWVGPKFNIDVSTKTTKALPSGNSELNKGEKQTEGSIALSYIF